MNYYDAAVPERRGERRSFVHGRIFGAAKGFISSGFNPLGAARGFVGGGGSGGAGALQPAFPVGPSGPCPKGVSQKGTPPGTCRGTNGQIYTASGPRSFAPVGQGFSTRGFQVGGVCVPPWFSDGQGGCELDLIPGPGGGGTGPVRDQPQPVGDAVMGRYGPALVPGVRVSETRICLPGMVLGKDKLCYNSRDVTNKERLHPRGRRPLLTGGQMRAITVAAGAGRALETKRKQLMKMGMIPKAQARRAKAPAKC